MTILQKILTKRAEDVSDLKEQKPSFQILAHNRPSLYETLKKANTLQVISEVKRASPSKGDIAIDVDPIEQAKLYEHAGAACISVLTEPHFFKGSYEDLNAVATNVAIPVLCKDFIIDEVQIDYAKAAGASVILLIVAALDDEKLSTLHTYATAQGLEVLVEVHTEEELMRALQIDAKIIGVNNRNLKTFIVDLAHTKAIGELIQPYDVAFISESGIQSSEDAKLVASYNANAILVGETLMKSANVIDDLKSLQVPLFVGEAK